MRTPLSPLHARQHGVTLIELMVALTLGLILTGAAIQVFVANKSTYRLTNALSHVQENGRYAMQQLAYDIRMAGYFGCGSRRQIDSNLVAADLDFIPAALPSDPDGDAYAAAVDTKENYLARNALRGFDGGTAWWVAAGPPLDLAGNALTVCDAATRNTASCQISDVVSVIRGAELGVHLTADMLAETDPLMVKTAEFAAMRPTITPDDDAPGEEDLVLLTDCESADLIRVRALDEVGDDTQIIPDAALEKKYLQGPAGGESATSSASLYSLTGGSYFVADAAVDNDGDGVPEPTAALYRIGHADEGTVPPAVLIAEGVEKMFIAYGLDTGGDESIEEYDTAAQIDARRLAGNENWERVVAVRISLLLKSKEDFVTNEPVAMTFVDGTIVNDGVNADRRLRLVFSQTISIRNRVQ